MEISTAGDVLIQLQGVWPLTSRYRLALARSLQSRAGQFSRRKEKLHRRTGLGSSGEFQGCFGGIAECFMLRALIHSRRK